MTAIRKTTLGPFEPNLYEYQFDVDGIMLPDPGNDMPRTLDRHFQFTKESFRYEFTSTVIVPPFRGYTLNSLEDSPKPFV